MKKDDYLFAVAHKKHRFLSFRINKKCILVSVTLRYIKRKDIDCKRWDEVIKNSRSPFIYGLSWYLDCVTNKNWDAIILDDYQAIMPLPFNTKLFGIPQLYQPPFTQQLGVFSQMSKIDVETFIQAIPEKFRKRQIALNHSNHLAESTQRTNLVVDLNLSRESIVANFSSSVRKRLRKMDGYSIFESKDVSGLIDLYRNELGHKVNLNNSTYDLAFELFQKVIEKNAGKIYVLEKDGEIVARGAFYECFNRVINVFAANNSSEPNAMTKLLSEVMFIHSNLEKVFDFEGSDIPGVKSYFLSFGSYEQNYSEYHFNKMPTLVNQLLKLRRNSV